MQTETRILAVILAGGLARRMDGASKPLADLAGSPLIERVVAVARRQNLPIAINLHQITPQAIEPFAQLGLPFIADAVPDHAGPLAGVLGALDHAAANGFDAVLSLPCDSPFLPDDLVARLVREARGGLACAASGGRVHPVIALWPVGLRFDLRRALIEEDQRAPGRFQQQHAGVAVDWPVNPRDPFFNVNTPADLAAAEALLRRTL
jgi:molybdopterin-guanine dinucleotide biosynthesis protein A